MAKKKAPPADDLLDTKPSRKKQAAAPTLPGSEAGLVEERGSAKFYDRSKGAPVDATVNPDQRWVLVTPAGTEYFHKKALGRKALRAAGKGSKPSAPAAPRKKREAAPVDDLLGDSTPVPVNDAPGALDEDLHASSDSSWKVPSVWSTDGGRYGLLVYCGRTRGKMLHSIDSGFAVGKIGLEQLYPTQAVSVAAAKALAAQRAKENLRPVEIVPGDMWWPAFERFTPEHFRNIFTLSTLGKTASAQAFMDKLSAEWDNLLSTAPDVDLLS